MSVLSCDRRGCDHIMCDRISYAHNWNLCWECFEELVARGPMNTADLTKFMETPPDRNVITEEASQRFWDAIFPMREIG